MSSSPIEETVRRNSECEDGDHDPHYDPIISLPLVEVNTNEENEEELLKLRARLYRYDLSDKEWKERGTGDIKLLRHTETNSVRIVMRRDKTLKICANHFITPDIVMNVHCNSNRAFNWSVFADFADETAKQELLAIKFRTPEQAAEWKTKFEEAQEIVRSKCPLYNGELVSDDDDETSSTTQSDASSPSREREDATKDKAKEDGVVLKLRELKVEDEKDNKTESSDK